jgi:hypothetical protein
MAGIKATGVFLLGSLAGFGVALLLYFARVLGPILPGLYLGPIDAFVAGSVLIAIGLLGSVVVARGSKSLQLRTSLVAIAMVAVLLGLMLEVRRRSKEFWGLALQHRAQAAALSTRYQLARLDPRVSKQQKAGLSMLSQWHDRMAERFERAANYPWQPLETGPPAPN